MLGGSADAGSVLILNESRPETSVTPRDPQIVKQEPNENPYLIGAFSTVNMVL
jgi:hypothetical protein